MVRLIDINVSSVASKKVTVVIISSKVMLPSRYFFMSQQNVLILISLLSSQQCVSNNLPWGMQAQAIIRQLKNTSLNIATNTHSSHQPAIPFKMIYKQFFLLALSPLSTVIASAATLRGVISLRSDYTEAEDDNGPTAREANTGTAHEKISVISSRNSVPSEGSSVESQSSTVVTSSSRSSSSGPFSNECLQGRFSYSNLVADVASVSVGVFDGEGTITEMDSIEINFPNPEAGGRVETSIPFNYGTYEVYPNGKGTMRFSMGGQGGPYYDPPALVEFVVTGTSGDGCEITSIDSFLSAASKDGNGNDVGVANQLVAPRFNKIADS